MPKPHTHIRTVRAPAVRTNGACVSAPRSRRPVSCVGVCSPRARAQGRVKGGRGRVCEVRVPSGWTRPTKSAWRCGCSLPLTTVARNVDNPRCFGPVCRSIGLPQKSLWKISRRLELYSLFRIVCDHVQSTWYTCSCGQNFARTEIETLRKRLYNWSSQRRSEPPRASRWCVYPRRSLAGHLRSPGIAARRARSSAPRHERADPRTRAKTRGQRARPARANRKRPSCHGPCS